MKHNLKLTIILLAMFIITQIIGLFIVNYYLNDNNVLPFGMEPQEEVKELCSGFQGVDLGICVVTNFIIMSVMFSIAILIFFLIIKYKSIWLMRTWFFIVIVIALGITLNAVLRTFNIPNAFFMGLGLALIFAYFKIIKRNLIVHNLTELLIYPGIAAVFVPIINFPVVILILIGISIYDIWAVWHSGIMQKMAKFQMNKLKVFGGFFVPYANKKVKDKIKALRLKYKGKEIPNSVAKKQNIKVNLAILGGGDVIFPIIAAGVFFKTFHSLWATLFVTLGASIALLYLFVFAKKKKFYPAMPYITTGIFLGMIVGWLLLTFL